MNLIGMLDWPFVRRVAVSMNLLRMPFVHRSWSVGKDYELIRQFNPLGRAPALVLPDGEAIIDSHAILDFLDETAAPEQALLPSSGKPRRDALRIVSVALGAAEKGVLQLYETVFRPGDKRHEPWIQRCRAQMHAALTELDRVSQMRAGEWLIGNRLTQADVTVTCVFSFLFDALDLSQSWVIYPALAAHCARCEALPEFSSAREKFQMPSGTSPIWLDCEGAAH
jgi:glutathione S-transferase